MLAFAARARWGGWGQRPMLRFCSALVWRSSCAGLQASGCRHKPTPSASLQWDCRRWRSTSRSWSGPSTSRRSFTSAGCPQYPGSWPVWPWLYSPCWLGLVNRSRAQGFLFAFLGLLPAWAAVAHVGAIVDRYLYLPMVGVAWAVAAAAQRPLARKLIVLVLVGLTYAAAQQVPVWKNDATLWRAAIERAPSGYAKGALARWLEDQGKPKDAAFWYREAVVQAPMPFQESCFNVSRIHLKLNDPARAVEVGEEALTLGCEPSPELVAPSHWHMPSWVTGTAIRRSTSVGRDPTGKRWSRTSPHAQRPGMSIRFALLSEPRLRRKERACAPRSCRCSTMAAQMLRRSRARSTVPSPRCRCRALPAQ